MVLDYGPLYLTAKPYMLVPLADPTGLVNVMSHLLVLYKWA